MSPTLLELIVAVLLLWVAWRIGVVLAPRVFASIVSSWRSFRPPSELEVWPPEKNVTPPPVPGDKPPIRPHAHPRN